MTETVFKAQRLSDLKVYIAKIMCSPKVVIRKQEIISRTKTVLCAASQKEDTEQGRIRIVRVESDVLKRSGATLLTVERSSPEQRQSWTPDSTQVRKPGSRPSAFEH